MAGRRDKIEQSVYAIITESRITFDAGLLGKDVVVLSFEVAHDLTEAVRDQS